MPKIAPPGRLAPPALESVVKATIATRVEVSWVMPATVGRRCGHPRRIRTPPPGYRRAGRPAGFDAQMGGQGVDEIKVFALPGRGRGQFCTRCPRIDPVPTMRGTWSLGSGLPATTFATAGMVNLFRGAPAARKGSVPNAPRSEDGCIRAVRVPNFPGGRGIAEGATVGMPTG